MISISMAAVMLFEQTFDFQDIAPSGLAREVYTLLMNPVSEARSRFHSFALPGMPFPMVRPFGL